LSPCLSPDDHHDFVASLLSFGRRLRRAPLPPDAAFRAIDAITDSIGCIVLGARQPLEAILHWRGINSEMHVSMLQNLLAVTLGITAVNQ
jgi:hypothetical protein